MGLWAKRRARLSGNCAHCIAVNGQNLMLKRGLTITKKTVNTVFLGSMILLTACGEIAKHSISSGTGINPILPLPNKTLLPTIHIAPAIGWPKATTPIAAAGLNVSSFASGLDHPRWLYVLPNGD